MKTIGIQILSTTFILLTITFLSSCSKPCHIQSSEFVEKLQACVGEWDDNIKIAKNIRSNELAPTIKELQAVLRKVQELKSPPCAEKVKLLAVDFMEKKIDNYIIFWKDQDDPNWAETYRAAKEARELFDPEFAKLKAGEPPYDK